METIEWKEILTWLVPLLLGLSSSPLITKAMTFWLSKREQIAKEVSIADGITTAADKAVDLMQQSMNRMEKDIQILTEKVVSLEQSLQAESKIRMECQKILELLEREAKNRKVPKVTARKKSTPK